MTTAGTIRLAELGATLAQLRADHEAQIAKLEELAVFRLRILARDGVDLNTDTLWRAVTTAIVLMKERRAMYAIELPAVATESEPPRETIAWKPKPEED